MPRVVQACGQDAASLGLFWKTPTGAGCGGGGQLSACRSATGLRLWFVDPAVACAQPWVFSRVEPKHLSRKP